MTLVISLFVFKIHFPEKFLTLIGYSISGVRYVSGSEDRSRMFIFFFFFFFFFFFIFYLLHLDDFCWTDTLKDDVQSSVLFVKEISEIQWFFGELKFSKARHSDEKNGAKEIISRERTNKNVKTLGSNNWITGRNIKWRNIHKVVFFLKIPNILLCQIRRQQMHLISKN